MKHRHLRRAWIYATLVSSIGWFTAVSTARAQGSRIPRSFDHAIYITIETIPPGADIHSISHADQTITGQLGVSPCVAVVGLNWAERFGRKNWGSLTAWCPGDACRAIMNEDKSYDVYFSFAAVKRGYVATNMEVAVATLTKPGFGWDKPDSWPNDVRLTLRLSPKEQESAPQTADVERPAPAKAPAVRRMILARSDTDLADGLGTVEVRSDREKTRIFVDGKLTGVTPLDIMMPEGEHSLVLKLNGYRPHVSRVSVVAGQTNRVDGLLPAAP